MILLGGLIDSMQQPRASRGYKRQNHSATVGKLRHWVKEVGIRKWR